MDKVQNAGHEIKAMDELAQMDSPIHRMSPLSKLLIVITYIFVTVSFYKYDLSGLFVMILFPVTGYAVSYVPIRLCFRRLRFIMPIVCVIGILNPFFDREVLITVFGVGISGGIISMLVLMLKGVLCLLASFLLIATTTIEDICVALRKIHVNSMITSLIMLTYRYISVLLQEAGLLITSYKLRAPGQRGIHISAWGSFLGQLLIRSVDRAGEIYDSMVLRGFNGEIVYSYREANRVMSAVAALIVIALIVMCRWVNIAVLLGQTATF